MGGQSQGERLDLRYTAAATPRFASSRYDFCEPDTLNQINNNKLCKQSVSLLRHVKLYKLQQALQAVGITFETR